MTMPTDGDPKVAAPDLYRSMTRVERWQIDNAFAGRLMYQGRNDPRYPDDQAPADVARKAFVRGIAIWYFGAAAPFLLVGAGAYSFLQSGTVNAASVGVAALAGVSVAVAIAMALLRLQVVNRYFAGQGGPAGVAVDRDVRKGRLQRGLILVPTTLLAALAIFGSGARHGSVAVSLVLTL
ncbi:hypothetical protein [Nocardioides sp. LS1]|uniref:hypothetical protein n=1 Tax=Nocardioides sp. LS1 TaxID=1027620 RepID=UPI0021AB8FAE|nr:hypothetical protein [Nocardioides sp. LS1]